MTALSKMRLAGVGLALALFVIDQWFKNYVLHTLKLRQVGAIEILPFFDLRYTENYGVSLGMLTAETPEMRYLLIAMTGGIAVIVLIWMLREKTWPDILGLAMVLGGALGNIRDRWIYGYVVDYADLHIGEFRPFLIFNIADAAITIGVLIILARALLVREKQEEPASPATET